MYRVEELSMGEFERGVLGENQKVKTVFEGSLDDALQYWSSYASGACDADAPCDNQNHSVAYFYRIVEVPEL